MTSEDKKMLEENPTKLLDSDTMIEEANAMHKGLSLRGANIFLTK